MNTTVIRDLEHNKLNIGLLSGAFN